MSARLKKGDEIIVITGKDKGRRGTVDEVLHNGKVLVGGVNLVKKHVKPDPNRGIQGGIVDKEMPIHASNVMIFNPATDKGDRVGFKMLGEGEAARKVRYFRSNGEVIDS